MKLKRIETMHELNKLDLFGSDPYFCAIYNLFAIERKENN